MFTGLVEAVGRVDRIAEIPGGMRMAVECPSLATQVAHGESVAVNGACLTVASSDRTRIVFDLSRETMTRTSFARLRSGYQVNLERALVASARLGGHIVNGHVDGVATVREIRPSGEFAAWRFELPLGLARYVVEKGCIAVDGISLTVTVIDGDTFEVALVPATLQATALVGVRIGDPVNIEVDVLAKYVENMVQAHMNQETKRPGRILAALREGGFMGPQ